MYYLSSIWIKILKIINLFSYLKIWIFICSLVTRTQNCCMFKKKMYRRFSINVIPKMYEMCMTVNVAWVKRVWDTRTDWQNLSFIEITFILYKPQAPLEVESYIINKKVSGYMCARNPITIELNMFRMWWSMRYLSGCWSHESAARVDLVPHRWNTNGMMFTIMSVVWRVLAEKITSSGTLGYSTSEHFP